LALSGEVLQQQVGQHLLQRDLGGEDGTPWQENRADWFY
jgi:hypothetical protein